MGYNNNNAGMHFVHYRKSDFEDLDYYDRLAIDEYKMKKQQMQQKIIDQNTKELLNSENDNEVDEYAEIKSEEIVKNNTLNVEKEKKRKQKKKRKTINMQKEKLIDIEYFINAIGCCETIFLLALERNIPIFDCIQESEEICQRDIRFEDKYLPESVKTIVFLNILADKMNCELYEFFVPNKEMITKRIYKILNKIEKKYCSEERLSMIAYDREKSPVDDTTIYENIELGFPQYYWDNLSEAQDVTNHYKWSISKTSPKNEEPYYTFTVLANQYGIYRGLIWKYMYAGADMLDETSGELADCFERIKKRYIDVHGVPNED